MRQYYSMVRFEGERPTAVLPSNALAKDAKASPSMKLYRDMDDPGTLVIDLNGKVNVYPWARVVFARVMDAPADAAAKKGKG